jgi:hypothetical protein
MSGGERRVGFEWPEPGRSPRRMPVRMVLRLQQTIGNREVVALLTRAPAATDDRPTLPVAGPMARLLAAGSRLLRLRPRFRNTAGS